MILKEGIIDEEILTWVDCTDSNDRLWVWGSYTETPSMAVCVLRSEDGDQMDRGVVTETEKHIISPSCIKPQEPLAISSSSNGPQFCINWHVTHWAATPSVLRRNSGDVIASHAVIEMLIIIFPPLVDTYFCLEYNHSKSYLNLFLLHLLMKTELGQLFSGFDVLSRPVKFSWK